MALRIFFEACTQYHSLYATTVRSHQWKTKAKGTFLTPAFRNVPTGVCPSTEGVPQLTSTPILPPPAGSGQGYPPPPPPPRAGHATDRIRRRRFASCDHAGELSITPRCKEHHCKQQQPITIAFADPGCERTFRQMAL